jgi:PKD repeat protein
MVAPLARAVRLTVAWSLLLASALAASCDKVALTAPTNSTITLFANTTTVPLNGSAEIVASVIESAGTAVQNGTLVTFTSTVGSVEPREARTENGRVTVRFVAGSISGTAKVGAFSGSAKATELEIKVGGAAASRVVLNVSPGTVPSSGGTVLLVATVTDADGNRVPGVPATFTATAGTLLNQTVLTDDNGEARTSLTTARQAQVTVTAGSQQAQVTINVNTPISVSITAPATSPTVGVAASFNVSVSATSNSATLRDVTVTFGDGDRVSLGTPTGSVAVSHVYRAAGTYTVTATATDATGETTSASTQVTVVAASRPLVTLTVPASTPASVIFTASVGISQNTANLAVDAVEFNFGDGNVKRVNGLQTTHAYSTPGSYNVRATVIFADGTRSTAEAGIRVTSP